MKDHEKIKILNKIMKNYKLGLLTIQDLEDEIKILILK